MSKRAPLTFKVEKVTETASDPKHTGSTANAQTRKRAKKDAKPGRDGRQFIAAHIMPEAAKQFKLLVVRQDSTTQDMLVEAINDLFAKHGLSRIA